MSGYSDEVAGQELLTRSRTAFLAKPFDQKRLREALSAVQQGR